MKKANMATGALITLMVGLIIAVIAISVSTDIIDTQTLTSQVNNDTFTGSTSTCTAVSSTCLSSSGIIVTNSTGGQALAASNYTTCATSTGGLDGIVLTEAGFNGESLNATYTALACGQITGTTGTIVNYVPLLLAVVALVAVAVFLR